MAQHENMKSAINWTFAAEVKQNQQLQQSPQSNVSSESITKIVSITQTRFSEEFWTEHTGKTFELIHTYPLQPMTLLYR